MHCPNSGELGEDLVAQWLQSTGWIILHRRFSSRWGEIDIIAEYDEESGKEQGSQEAGEKFLTSNSSLLTPHSPLPTLCWHLLKSKPVVQVVGMPGEEAQSLHKSKQKSVVQLKYS
ncbi:MAG: YraN family protein [Nostoc sp. DedQUE04]|nr:YraN family protein [Nostoc sp. DedQUE04]MDZ8135074.1 YraN family protein [Nostoc sp. DedQUE04]